jgi:diguanylate cyclase (GGDEF)-like protein/PAS domain S-box-containing protein
LPKGTTAFGSRTGAAKRPIYWALAAILFVATGLCAVCVYLLAEMRANTREHASEIAAHLAAAIDNDVQRNIESIDLSLQAVVDGLKRPDINQISPDLRQVVLFDRSATARHLGLIIVTDEFGTVWLDSRTDRPAPANAADRDYYQVHKDNDHVGLYIGRPILGRLTGQEAIGISRRLSHSDGSFAGVVAAGLKLDYFKNLFSNVALGPGSNVTLASTDGTILMRWPYDAKFIGLQIKTAELYSHLARAKQGEFEGKARTDGVMRLTVYRQIGDLPLVIGVGQSTATIYSQWRKYTVTLGISAAILFAIISLLFIYCVREYKRRARSEARLRAALEHMPQGLCMFDRQRRLVICNDRYASIYKLPKNLCAAGVKYSEIIAHRVLTGVLKGASGLRDLPRQLSALTSSLPVEKRSTRIDEHSDGSLFRVIREPTEDGGWVATHEDITQQRRAERDLEETKAFLDSIIQNVPLAIVVKDANTRKIVLANHAYEMVVGRPQVDLIGRSVTDIFPPAEAELMDKADRAAVQDSRTIKTDEYNVTTRQNGARTLTTSRIAVHDTQGNPKYLVLVIEDVTERKNSERRIAFMAHHDVLTGLANRAALAQKIEENVARQRRHGTPFAIFLLDLDRFKQVNDTLGHPAGDALLREVAARLKATLRETDVLARLGGDEFAIIQASDGDQYAAARGLAERVVETIAKPFIVEEKEVSVSASIGIVLAAEYRADSGALLKMADLALYRTKSNGRNGYSFFDPSMSEAASARQEMESDLRNAISKNELELHYQPIIDARTGKMCGAEALLRWKHPGKGMIAPDQFIPLAEETDLINQIGGWVLRTACNEAARWPAEVKVAVNLSPVQLREGNLLDVVIYTLAESGLPPERLELEITETALIESAADLLPMLRKFKNLGISISLDDFGTGYSSLSRLTMFPFDKIKIDRSFTQNLTKRSDCAAIISATLMIAQSLDMATTAEGVETADQCRLLRLAGATSLQGYLFKNPGPAADLDFDHVYINAGMKDAA